MLKQATVEQVRKQELPRENTTISIVMRHYPRGIKKEWSDEFRDMLAPDPTLFKEWKALEMQVGHEEAFKMTNYEEHFKLTPVALYLLKLYSELSHKKDIYLVCQCGLGERCHREILMLIAKNKYGAVIDKVHNEYPVIEKRIPTFQDQLKLW